MPAIVALTEKSQSSLACRLYQIAVSTASTVADICDVHPVSVEVTGTDWKFEVQAIAHLLAGQGLLMLIGRDALSNVQFTYHGEFGIFTVSF